MMIKIGILTISDRASSGIYEDKGGPELISILKSYLLNEIEFFYEIIADEFELISKRLIFLSDTQNCDLIFTTGGTGPAVRDITPEATLSVLDKELPGFGEEMRRASLKYVPTAILSRQLAGIRGKSLIVNLPGNPKAIKECLDPIFPAIPCCLDIIKAGYIRASELAPKIFRPKHLQTK